MRINDNGTATLSLVTPCPGFLGRIDVSSSHRLSSERQTLGNLQHLKGVICFSVLQLSNILCVSVHLLAVSE